MWIWHHMPSLTGIKVQQLHLQSMMVYSEWASYSQFHTPVQGNSPQRSWTGGWVGHRPSLDAVVKRNTPGFSPQSWGPWSSHYTDSATPRDSDQRNNHIILANTYSLHNDLVSACSYCLCILYMVMYSIINVSSVPFISCSFLSLL
jgi:hypothetical protein